MAYGPAIMFLKQYMTGRKHIKNIWTIGETWRQKATKPFHKGSVSQWLKSNDDSFSDWAAVACANLWPDLVITCHLRARFEYFEKWP